MEFTHVSVLARECMEALQPERGGVFVDCTAGGGGHSYEIARRLGGGGRLICLDRDDAALAACEKRLAEFSDRVTLVKANFSEISAVLNTLGIPLIDGVLWDLGVSSYQLDEKSRGFSYTADAPLDMRMDQSCGKTAADIVNTYSESELNRVIRDYGEEKFSLKIARCICESREKSPIRTTAELSDIICSAIPATAKHKEKQHPARRTFQAIRIEVNGELEAIAPSIQDAVSHLHAGGRAAVITFHSLEDRIVKQTFASLSSGCTCPPDFPVCVCGRKPTIQLLNKKPILPSDEELAENFRSHSAKLRCAEKLA